MNKVKEKHNSTSKEVAKQNKVKEKHNSTSKEVAKLNKAKWKGNFNRIRKQNF